MFKIMNSKAEPISLLSLKNLIGNIYSPFKGFRQEDAHEFLIKLIELMYEDLGRRRTTPQYSHQCMLDDYIGGDDSRISGILQGVHRITILCTVCGNNSSSFEPFGVLSLSPSPTKESSVQGLLRSFYGNAEIEYTCSKCGKNGSCIQKYEVEKLPQVLIIHLKRFEVNSQEIRKNEKYVDFPLKNLDIGSKKFVCNLKGVTNHYGTLNAGHYISFCKPNNEGKWYKCDDSKVIKMKTSIKTHNAYLLFYENSSR